jgi:hypothetical protein
MQIIDNKFGKFFGPSLTYTGYALMAAGLLSISYSLTSLFLIIPGLFIAFTYTGTIIDTENKRVKPYTSHFGFIRTGNWIEVNQFSRFSIEKATRGYTAYSRGSVRLDMKISDINLLLIYKEKKGKVVLNRFTKFEDARNEMDRLSEILFPGIENIKPEITVHPDSDS